MLVSFGKTTVPVAGTPIQVVAALTSGSPIRFTCHSFLVEALPGNTGFLYIGLSASMNRTTLTGVVVVLPIPTSNFIPSFSATLSMSADALRISDIWLDVDVSGDGGLISALIS